MNRLRELTENAHERRLLVSELDDRYGRPRRHRAHVQVRRLRHAKAARPIREFETREAKGRGPSLATGAGGYPVLVATKFKTAVAYEPTGDQPQAIEQLAAGLRGGERYQSLLGATGTGKTATMAWIIEEVQRPALVIAHNKTLAAQLCNEFREFFPDNAVEYFVSYYDYYQPEAYVPQADLYIEKDSSRNDDIDRLRHSATSSLLSRRDVDHRRLRLVHLRPRLAGGVREAGRLCCTSARSTTATSSCAS